MAARRLRVSLVQAASSLVPAENLAALDVVADVGADSDLVVLPEAFARDFGSPGSDLSAYAEPLDGPFVSRVRALSEVHDVAVLAGMFESAPGDLPFNTLVLADRGELTTYRKIHLYDSFGYRESDVLTAGPVAPVVADVRGVRLGLMTCYDIRFPEHSRLLVSAGAEVLALPSAWVAGERKLDHWTTLLRARAIESVSFVVAAAQSAPRYTGHSLAVSPYGEVLAEAGDDDTVLRVTLDLDEVAAARKANPSLDNRRLPDPRW